VAQAIEHVIFEYLLCKHEAISSNPIEGRKEKERKRNNVSWRNSSQIVCA
jgi:hypothetical protein